MVHMEGEIVINQPVETVFDFVADARNEPHYNPRIRRAEKTSDGPIGIGTTFRSETSGIGRASEWIIEITSYQRPRQLASSIHTAAVDIRGVQTFDPIEGGTRMRWSWEVKPRGAFKLVAPLIGRMGQRLEERNWEKLKHFLESEDAAPRQA